MSFAPENAQPPLALTAVAILIIAGLLVGAVSFGVRRLAVKEKERLIEETPVERARPVKPKAEEAPSVTPEDDAKKIQQELERLEREGRDETSSSD